MTGYPNWLSALRVHLLTVTAGDLAREAVHLPLYTLWRTGTAGEKLFAVVLGDLLIALASLARGLGLVLAGHRDWPVRRFGAVAALTVAFGLGYTGFSEWLSAVVRESQWAGGQRRHFRPGSRPGPLDFNVAARARRAEPVRPWRASRHLAGTGVAYRVIREVSGFPAVAFGLISGAERG